MKKILLLFTIFATYNVTTLYGQVGIGTTSPDPSSILDITSSNSGLLIPRVSLQGVLDVTTIPSPAIGLLVFNINEAVLPKGFYYWDGSWARVGVATSSGSAGSDYWELDGNAISSNDFIGTTNYQSLVFKVNNDNFAKFHPNGGVTIGKGASANDESSVAIGKNALAANNNEAVALGVDAKANGYQSMALGKSAEATNNGATALGQTSVASGYLSSALGYNATASSNNATAIGTRAIASGEQTSAIGYQSNASGLNAMAIGYQTNVSGQNATAIGYQATTAQNNAIVLGSANAKIGMGTSSPDEKLHVVGSVKIVDGTQANNYVLTSDANGKASWKNPSTLTSSVAYGEIYKSSNTYMVAGQISFNVVNTNATTNVTASSTSNSIQVSTTGVYRITYTIGLGKYGSGNGNGSEIVPEFYLGIYGTEIPGTRTFVTIANNEKESITLTKLCRLNAYDAVSVYASMTNYDTYIMSNATTLSVEKIN
jgi:hypothetical protein